MQYIRYIVLLYLLFNYSFNSGQVNLSSSLTACYNLNANANDPINSLNGMLSNVSSTIDRFNNTGSALSFSGTNSSMVLLPNSSLIKPSTDVTVSGWYKVNSFTN